MAKPLAEVVVLETNRSACIASVREVLEDALAETAAGNVIAVGIAVVRADGAVSSRRSDTDDVGRLLGAIALLQGRAVRSCDD